jgi:hypothetical protein
VQLEAQTIEVPSTSLVTCKESWSWGRSLKSVVQLEAQTVEVIKAQRETTTSQEEQPQVVSS